jgi:hypothetical protein
MPKAKTTKAKSNGSALGFEAQLSEKLVEEHGGRIGDAAVLFRPCRAGFVRGR